MRHLRISLFTCPAALALPAIALAHASSHDHLGPLEAMAHFLGEHAALGLVAGSAAVVWMLVSRRARGRHPGDGTGARRR